MFSFVMQMLLAMAAGLSQKRAGLMPQRSTLQRYQDSDTEKYVVGVTNKLGITRYSHKKVQARRSNGTSWWPDSAERVSRFVGATDLSDNVSWGWHHPNGVYGTIPVGAPLIDNESNIYLASDDAVRKFTASGDLLWSYAPRGQIAAAPSLVATTASSSRRSSAGLERPAGMDDVLQYQLRPAGLESGDMEDEEGEEELVPGWAQLGGRAPASQLFGAVRVGDRVKVRPGVGGHSDGAEHHDAGETGEVVKLVSEVGGMSAVIRWQSGREGRTPVDSMKETLRLFSPKSTVERSSSILVGSTTSGYVFAIDIATGNEVWTTVASSQIAGVKGTVSGSGGKVFVATNRCVDRYCYRYRSTTNPLTPGNTYVRALNAVDGSQIWAFKPKSPLWNFVPQFGGDGGTVMFNDYEGAVYSLNIETGALIWRAEGAMGTHTQSSCVYSSELNQVFAMGVNNYEGEFCNPYVPKGIQPACGTQVDAPGWVRALNASSGKVQWETGLPQPPASAAVGFLNTPRFHMRLVVSMGFNCHYGAASALWVVSPETGHPRVKVDGPTLWGAECAGDREGGDIRRAMAGRAYCEPGSWSTPVIDGNGDIFVGSQVGELQRLGADSAAATGSKDFRLLSTLTTDVAFQDQAIALAPNIMAVSTCTSLIVFHAYLNNESFGLNGTWEFMPGRENYPAWEVET